MLKTKTYLLLLFIICFFVGCLNEKATLRRGFRHFRRNEYNAAIRAFNRVLKNNPSNVIAYFYRGFCYSDLKDYNKAIFDWKKCVELKPEFIEAYVNLGDTYWDLKQTNNAIKYLNKGIEIKPDWIALTNAYLDRSYIYYNFGDYKNSLLDCAKLVDLDSNNFNFINNYAYSLSVCPEAKYRNGKKAIELAKRAMDMIEKTANGFQKISVMDTLAAAYAEVGDFKQAIKVQKKLIELEKKSGKTKELKEFEERLKTYKNNKPWREKKM